MSPPMFPRMTPGYVEGQIVILKEKERARSQIIDAQQQRIDELERMLDISNKILNAYKRQWEKATDAWKQERMKKQFAEKEANRVTDVSQKLRGEIMRLRAEISGLRMDVALGRI